MRQLTPVSDKLVAMSSNSGKKESVAASRQRLTPSSVFGFSMRQFLVALVLLVVTYPFIIDLPHGDLIANGLMMVLLVSAAMAVGKRNAKLTMALAALAILGHWLDRQGHQLIPVWIITGTQMVFAGFVVVQLLRYVLRASLVNAEVLCAGISAYIMLAIFWTPAYMMVSEFNSASFSGTHLAADKVLNHFDALYLSFVTLTCVGCNDITPLSRVARMLLMTESMTGVLFLTVLLARLVAMYSHTSQPEEFDDRE